MRPDAIEVLLIAAVAAVDTRRSVLDRCPTTIESLSSKVKAN
jgi:hypothetical protein